MIPGLVCCSNAVVSQTDSVRTCSGKSRRADRAYSVIREADNFPQPALMSPGRSLAANSLGQYLLVNNELSTCIFKFT